MSQYTPGYVWAKCFYLLAYLWIYPIAHRLIIIVEVGMRRVDVDRDREMQTTTEQNIFAYTKFAVIFDFRFLVP